MDSVTVGTALQLLGVATAAIGLVKVWRDYAPPGLGFLDEQAERLTDLHGRLEDAGRVLLSRLGSPPKIVGTGNVTVPAMTASGVGQAFDAKAMIGYADIPPGQDIDKTLQQLANRTDTLLNKISAIEDELGEKVRQVIDAVDEVHGQLDYTRDLIKKETRGLALGGIQLSAFGLIVTAVGLFLVLIAPHLA